MPSLRCGAVWQCLGLAVACLALPASAAAQTVWSDLTFSFAKLDDADHTLPENQDRITPDVWLTRDFTGGIFNAKFENGFVIRDPTVISPLLTEWATDINNLGETISAENWDLLAFDTWLNAFGGSVGVGHNIVDRDAVLRLIGDSESDLDDIYLDIRFSIWTQGGGGGFAYMRAEPPPETSGDYNGDLVVNTADYTLWRDTLTTTVDNPGDGADGFADGVIDELDYDYWKERFGTEITPGAAASAGHASVVPEPTALLLVVGALLALPLNCRMIWRGPGIAI